MKVGRCRLNSFQRKLYCFKPKTSKYCLKPQILGYRCPNLEWTKEAVIEEAKKGVTELSSLGGFTDDAIEYVKRFRPNLRLRQGNTIIKRSMKKG
jgi:hypothetical protein